MQLTGYFVEYLIIGSLSLLWLLPLLEELHISFPDNTGVIVLLAPSLYAIGMIVDVVGHYVTLFHRRRIRKKAKAKYGRRYGITKIEYATIDVDLVSVNPDLAKEAAKRTTRTRVARGALINAICAFPIWITISWSKLSILDLPKKGLWNAPYRESSENWNRRKKKVSHFLILEKCARKPWRPSLRLPDGQK